MDQNMLLLAISTIVIIITMIANNRRGKIPISAACLILLIGYAAVSHDMVEAQISYLIQNNSLPIRYFDPINGYAFNYDTANHFLSATSIYLMLCHIAALVESRVGDFKHFKYVYILLALAYLVLVIVLTIQFIQVGMFIAIPASIFLMLTLQLSRN